MKARINLILCLLFIAITISLIAVSFGWYAAEAGEVYFEDSSVSIFTSDNDLYYGGAHFEFVTTMSRINETTTFKVHNEAKPYYGQDGIFNGEYIILLKMDKSGVDDEGNPLSNNGYPYIEHVDLYLEYPEAAEFNTTYTNQTEYEKDFQIIYIAYEEGSGTATQIERDSSVTPEYIAIIFGNGSSIFKYSSNQYLGYKFAIYMNYYNKAN